MSAQYQVYVLQNEAAKRYIGLSEDVDNRLIQHNNGESKWTAGKGPWSIIWKSNPMNLTDVRKLENTLKKAKGGNQFYEITKLPRPDK